MVSEVKTLPVLPINLITKRSKKVSAGRNVTILAKSGADFFIKNNIVNQIPTTSITKYAPVSKSSVIVEPKNFKRSEYLIKIEKIYEHIFKIIWPWSK